MSALQKLLEDNGYETRSYSGRSMFGKECLAVTLEEGSESPLTFALNLGEAIEDSNNDGEFPYIMLPNIKSDALGLDFIVYFPDVRYEER